MPRPSRTSAGVVSPGATAILYPMPTILQRMGTMLLHRHTLTLHPRMTPTCPRPPSMSLMRRPPSLRVITHRRMATTATIRRRTASMMSIRPPTATERASCCAKFQGGCRKLTTNPPSPPGPLGVVAVAGMRLDPAQQRIVGVALIGAAIEGLAVGRRERRVEIEPCHKVGVLNKRLAEGNEIGAALCDGLIGARFIEAVIGDDDAAEAALDLIIVEGRDWRAAGVARNDMAVAEALARERARDLVEQGLRVAVGNVALPVLRRDAQAGALRPDDRCHRIQHLEQ